MAKEDIIEIDGRTGEGGGQIIRIAIGLAALTTQAVRITNIRGNRPKGGGLKNQHCTSIQWLAEVTDADVEGLRVGSKTLTFMPRRSPSQVAQRQFAIKGPSGAASALLIFQAILPFLLFTGRSGEEPVRLTISGGTNTSFSPTFEYLDQVLLPTLEERFSIFVERGLNRRAWSLGAQSTGEIWLKIYPIPPAKTLKFIPPKVQSSSDTEVRNVSVSIIGPSVSHKALQDLLTDNLKELFPATDVDFKFVEDSRTDGRWYILLVATSADGLRWGHDVVCGMPKKTKSRDIFVLRLVQDLCKGLYKEMSIGGHADVHLQDQVVCFQALSEGFSYFPRSEANGQRGTAAVDLVELVHNPKACNDRLRRDAVDRPFGSGSLHTQSARWVVSRLLPNVAFYDNGDIVKGVGFTPA